MLRQVQRWLYEIYNLLVNCQELMWRQDLFQVVISPKKGDLANTRFKLYFDSLLYTFT